MKRRGEGEQVARAQRGPGVGHACARRSGRGWWSPRASASAKIASAMVGSASAATVISRLAPMPAERRARVEAGQREEEGAEQEQVDDHEQVADRRRRAAAPRGAGRGSVTATVLAKTTKGAARKSHEALLETTTSLANSLRSSRYGCQPGRPRRFCSRAFSQRMSPTSPGARQQRERRLRRPRAAYAAHHGPVTTQAAAGAPRSATTR